jgi:hypothetical protein
VGESKKAILYLPEKNVQNRLLDPKESMRAAYSEKINFDQVMKIFREVIKGNGVDIEGGQRS